MCEEEIKKATASVLKYILPDTWSEEKKEDDPITAERVVEAIKDGKDVEIINAVIDGPFILKSVNAEGKVTIQRTKIRGPIDWSYVTFKRVLNLKNSIFETDATFATVTVEKDIFFDGATFCEKAKFSNITVMGVFYSRSTTFKKEVTFEDGIFKKKIEFAKSIFGGETDFSGVRIDSYANFIEAEFTQLADFHGAQIEEGVFFMPATFKGVANFASARIGSTADFTGATFTQQAIFNGAQIEGSAFFNPATFEEKADFIGARIGGIADFTGAEFKQQAIFHQVQIEGAAFFNPATFEGEADFAYARIGSVAEFTGATFKQQAIFNRTQIEGDAEFNGATFKKQAIFNSAQIKDSAFFKPAYLFSWDSVPGDDDKKLKKFLRANFDIGWAENSEILKSYDGETISIFKYGKSAEIIIDEKKEKATLKITDGRIHKLKVKKENGKLNIYNPATFGGEADFGSARIGSTAMFKGAVFKRQASFNGAQIEGVAFFNPATFVGEANFVSARIGSNAEFTGAVFKQQAIFNRTQIEESAFFDPATFWGEANFVSARIGSNAEFTGAVFKQQAIFNRTQIEGDAFFNPATFEGEANFGSARIGSNAVFNGAEFKQQAYFDSAQIERETHFKGTVFANNVSFQDTTLKTVFWGEPNVQFKNIDLRGGIYDRFQPIPFWKQLMDHLDPYDRRPFTQLEETFRRAGKDKLADDVYYERKCREYTENIAIRKPIAWDAWLHSALRKHGSWRALLYSLRKLSDLLLDRFLFCFTGYGVRLYRLLLLIVPILIIGTYIFQLEGAVTPELHSALPWSEAFCVCLNTFLPVIEIPSGADWKPSSQIIPIIPVLNIKFTTFATLLVLAGWILVPVAVAGITGLLKRPK